VKKKEHSRKPPVTDGNAMLCRLLDTERVAGRGQYIADGVWVGTKTLFADPQTEPLQEVIRSQLPPGTTWHLQGWGVVLEAGARMGRHDHKFPGNVWSGVYYLQSGGGGIEFDDGSYQPEESTVIVFPSDKPHSVTATERRYSIAFNARA
jgi:quercetin dioxygenase-like cupin family protein